MILKSTFIGVTAIAIALTSFDLRPAAAAPEGGPAIVKKNTGADEISAQRKRRYRTNPAVPLAAFGAIVGTIGAVAAANNRRAYYDSYYHAPGYGYYDGAGLRLLRRICRSARLSVRAAGLSLAAGLSTARLLQPLGRLRRPARLSRPERERAGADELRECRGPERPGAARASANAQSRVAATDEA